VWGKGGGNSMLQSARETGHSAGLDDTQMCVTDATPTSQNSSAACGSPASAALTSCAVQT
jgi:hypothetical protein